MGRKILVAVDDSENAMRAVALIADLFGRDNPVTLLSIVPDTAAMCEMNSPELTPYFRAEQTAFCTLEDRKRLLLREAMDKAKAFLVQAGFPEEAVVLKLENRRRGVARDIIDMAQDGYDLVVMGKTGVSGVKDFLLGSVSQKVLYGARNVSVLFVS